MAIKCCKDCVAPKRHVGCHGTCPEYLKEKAEHDERAAEDYKRRKLNQDLNEQRYRAVTKAERNKRKGD